MARLCRHPHPLPQRPAAQVGPHREPRRLRSLPQLCRLGCCDPHADRSRPALLLMHPLGSQPEPAHSFGLVLEDAAPISHGLPSLYLQWDLAGRKSA